MVINKVTTCSYQQKLASQYVQAQAGKPAYHIIPHNKLYTIPCSHTYHVRIPILQTQTYQTTAIYVISDVVPILTKKATKYSPFSDHIYIKNINKQL